MPYFMKLRKFSVIELCVNHLIVKKCSNILMSFESVAQLPSAGQSM